MISLGIISASGLLRGVDPPRGVDEEDRGVDEELALRETSLGSELELGGSDGVADEPLVDGSEGEDEDEDEDVVDFGV